jgi:Metallo-peptidase family M12B Reprolysin-like/Secretion system C-terminal sorting domain
MKKTLLFSVLFSFITVLGFSQSNDYWTVHNEAAGKITTDKAVARLSFPKTFKLFDLNVAPLQQKLFTIVGSNNVGRSTIISLPNTNGNLEEFEVYEASNFDPALQARFPLIRAFSGKGITDKASTLKISISPRGIQTMIFRTDKENEFIEAYSQDHTVYAVFNSRRDKGQLAWTCSTDDHALVTDVNSQMSHRPESSDGTLKTFRLAQSCNGEYANFFGASIAGTPADEALVMAAYNATLTRCNGVYEKDLAIHFNLIPTTTAVIFYNPTTDPYTTLANWNGQLQTILNGNIGAANYDLGHMFGASGGGGNAGCIGCVCNDANKGSGITSPADNIPQGDNFDIDYVVHEVGHQIGGNHTFSMNNEGSGVNKEVGSGITIMGYAGITAQDVAPHSIDIFHQASIQQIQNNLATKTCPITTSLVPTNATPVVAPVANRTIPKSTPFVLTGSATDANAGDVLTYCWEQNDNGTGFTGNASVASPTKTGGPNWLSFSPTTNPSRTMPRLSTVLAGLFVTPVLPGGDAIANIEALSSVGRTLNFRLTVRDNAAYIPLSKVAQTSFTDMTVTVDAATGPFLVTSPNTNVSWPSSSMQNITWDVAGTTGAPINCSDVKISFSNDGGLTFPTVLAASTPNDGSEMLLMPSTATTTARIKVEAIGNIFFDISNTNFTLTAPVSDFNLGPVTSTTVACPAPATVAVSVPTGATGGFVNPITLTATAGVPAGTTVTFGTNPVAPGSSSVVTLNNANTLAAGSYTVTVSGAATGASTKTINITFNITAGAGPVLTSSPIAQTVCAPATATFTVATAAAPVTYQWQSATAAAPATFTNIAGATTASFTTAATTAAMNGNMYRCIVATQCGSTTSTAAMLTVNTPAVITLQPSNFPACTGLTATFTAAATGTGVTYQWQSANAAAGPFTNIVGATNASYTTGAINVATATFYQVIVTTTVCPATITSNVVQLTISSTTLIVTEPVAQTVCVPAAATFIAASTGTGSAGGPLLYQWQVATAAAPTVFTNIAGANAPIYNTGATTAAMNGNIYHVIVIGACNVATSANVTLTTNTVAALGTTLPTAQTVCNGVTATFTGSATGTGVTYQWQVSTTGAAGTYTNVVGGTGATTASYTTAPTVPTMNGNYYRLVATTTTCPATVTTTPVLLTVNTVAVINTNHAPQSACIPQTATFTVAATGTGLTYQWQVAVAGSTTFTDIAGATSATYVTPATTLAMNGNKYRVNILSTCSPTTPTTSVESVLTVNNPVTISAQPTVQSGCSNDNYTFSITALSPGNTITYAWEVSTNGAAGPFTPLTNGGPYAGVNTNTLAINNAPLFLNGNYYRVFISVPCGTGISSSYSNAALFNISSKPTVVLTKPAVSNTNAAANTILTTTVSPFNIGQNATYTWKKNNVIIPNTLASTSIVVPVDDAGSYQVSITDAATGCIATSNIIVTDALTSDNLLSGRVFIYPNPVSTRMIVRYNNSATGNRATSIAVYDEKGSRVITKAFTIVGTNGRMEIDMSRLALGTYIVYVVDASGKKLAAGKAVKVQ